MARRLSDYAKQLSQPYLLLAFYGAFASAGALIILPSILGIESGPGNVPALDFSLQRIFLGSVILLAALIFLGAAIKSIKDHDWAEKLWDRGVRRKTVSDVILWGAAASFLVGWIGWFLPVYRIAENLSEYIVRLRPVIIWITTISIATLLLIFLERGKGQVRSLITSNKIAIRAGIIALTILFLVGALIAATGVGIRIREDYWYGAGVPALGLQIIFSLVIGAFVFWVELRMESKSFRKFDLTACIVIWAITAVVWAREPLRHTFFMPGPYAPNSEFFPYSDGALFDMGSQFALIGQGIFNGQYFDRALYTAFLTYLHALMGQNSEQLMAAQAVIYAVFPVIVYLIGKTLHSRAVGSAAGILVLFRGINSIAAATWIDLASPKMMLTDFPTAIGIALVLLFLLTWMKRPSKLHFMVWAGGVLGLTLMLRIHVLLLLPIMLVYLFISTHPRKKLLLAGALLVMGMLTATLPWDMRNHAKGTPMFYMYYARIYYVLQQRFGFPADTFIPESPAVHIRVLHSERLRSGSLIQPDANEIGPRSCDTKACSITNHFLHNLTSSVLFLPASFVLDDLWHTVKENTPYWQQNWRGEGFSATQGFFLTLNLAMIALGIGAAWQHSKFIGFLPAVVLLTYILSNALALTSGGRYVAPVDWIIALYFMIGALQLAAWAFNLLGFAPHPETAQMDGETTSKAIPPIKNAGLILGTLALVFAVGALVPLAETPFNRRYQTSTPAETLAMLDEQGWLEKAHLDKEALTGFLNYPGAEIIVGRALYPRYYRIYDGEPGRDYPYIALDFPRLVFTAIGPFGEAGIILPGSEPDFIPQAADVVTLGCRGNQYMDALAVFVLTEPGAVYLRSPESALQCPLQEIYCENNDLCWPKPK